jgi:SAM-dependent methyltransferase
MKNSPYSVFAKYYDELTLDVNYEKRVQYILDLAYFYGFSSPCETYKPIVLDLACGTGNMTQILSELEYDVVGVDSSVEMLSVAQSKVVNLKNPPIFLCQQMQKLDLYGTVDLAVCSLDAINHLIEESDVKEAFKRVFLFLNKGGIFIFDLHTLYKLENILGNNAFIYDNKNVYCVWQNSFDKKTLMVSYKLDFFEKTIQKNNYYRQSESFCEKGYPIDTICKWLEEIGFEVKAVYNEFTKEKPKQKCERVYIVANK